MLTAEQKALQESDVATLQGQVSELNKQLGIETKRADAATRTAEELLIQAKTHAWNARHMKEAADRGRGLFEKYRAATSIIDEMADQLKKLDVVGEQFKALKRVATSMYEFIMDGQVTRAISKVLHGEGKERIKAFENILMRCESVEEVNSTYKSLKEAADTLQPKLKPKDPQIPDRQVIKELWSKSGKPLDPKDTKIDESKQVGIRHIPSANGKQLDAHGSSRSDMIALTRSLLKKGVNG